MCVISRVPSGVGRVDSSSEVKTRVDGPSPDLSLLENRMVILGCGGSMPEVVRVVTSTNLPAVVCHLLLNFLQFVGPLLFFC